MRQATSRTPTRVLIPCMAYRARCCPSLHLVELLQLRPAFGAKLLEWGDAHPARHGVSTQDLTESAMTFASPCCDARGFTRGFPRPFGFSPCSDLVMCLVGDISDNAPQGSGGGYRFMHPRVSRCTV